MDVCCCCCCSVTMSDSFTTPWTVAHQAPLYLRFPRQEHWSGFPFPSLGDLPDPRFEPVSPALQAKSLPLSHPGNPIDIYSILHFKKKSVTINQIVLSILIGLKQ